jgi:hypothetical protein
MALNRDVVNGIETILKVIGDLPSGTQETGRGGW